MRFAALNVAAVLAATIASIVSLWAPAGAEGHRVAFGAYTEGAPWDRGAMERFVDRVGRRPVIWHTYRSWDQDPFPRDSLRNADEMGAVTLVTWEPYGRDLRSIASGRYDSYVRDSAREAVAWGGPVLLRFAHEMNGGWYPWGVNGNSSRDYRRAWRHVVRVFRRRHATNVKWVWAPNTGSFDSLFPGDHYVDFTGLDGYNWGAKWGVWDSFEEVFDSSYRAITRLSRRPLIITEFGANAHGGNKAAWIKHAFSRKVAHRYPRIRALVWFDKSQDGADWRVDSSPDVLRAFRHAIAKPLFRLDADGIFRGHGRGDHHPEPPPADPPADPAPDDPSPLAGARSPKPRCSPRTGRFRRVASDWTIRVGIHCNGRVTSCFGAVRVRHGRRQLGRARLELWAHRTTPVTIGLPGWARSSLASHARLRTRIWLDVMRGRCRGGRVHHVRLSR